MSSMRCDTVFRARRHDLPHAVIVMVGGNDIDKCDVPPQRVGMEVYTLARDLVRCDVNHVTVCQVLCRNSWRHFSYQEGADRVSCVNEFLLAACVGPGNVAFWKHRGMWWEGARYISYRRNTLQFPRKFQAVQECTGGYIPGKPVVSAPLYCRKFMYMYVCMYVSSYCVLIFVRTHCLCPQFTQGILGNRTLGCGSSDDHPPSHLASRLGGTVATLLQASLAPSTRLMYERSWRKITNFFVFLGLSQQLPVAVSTLLLFVAHLHELSYSPA